QAELFAAKLGKLKEASAAQEMAVHRVKRELREAEEKLALTKRWAREIQNLTQPLLKEVEQLHTFFTTDMVRAIAYLAQVVKTLDAYAGIATPGAGAAARPPAAADTAMESGDATSSGTNEAASPKTAKGKQP